MELILLKPLRGLGNVGEVVNVANGYARNFLMPKEFAIRATEQNKKEILARKKDLEIESAKIRDIAKEHIVSYADKHFIFIKNASYDGKLYGAVSAKEIAETLSTESYKITAEHIHLGNPIKKIGVFEVILSLHPEVECKIFINVAKTSEEADLAALA
jgi:large subunit ribosomal protein L9